MKKWMKNCLNARMKIVKILSDTQIQGLISDQRNFVNSGIKGKHLKMEKLYLKELEDYHFSGYDILRRVA